MGSILSSIRPSTWHFPSPGLYGVMTRLFYPNLVDSLVSVWLPRRCLHCGAVVPGVPTRSPGLPGRGALCVECAVLLDESQLMRFDLPLSVGPFALAARWMFSDASPVRSLHHAFKYEGRTDMGPVLAGALAEVVRAVAPQGTGWPGAGHPGTGWPGAGSVVCTGVPSHRLRVLERGYCQAHLLAECLAAELGVPVRGRLLERREHARSQTAFSAAERRRNVAQAFRIVGSADIPPAVVLVDDVVTTGATLLACAGALRSAGCQWVLLAAPGVRPPLPLGGHFQPV